MAVSIPREDIKREVDYAGLVFAGNRIIGLSTDTKPTTFIDGTALPAGTVFEQRDPTDRGAVPTVRLFVFDGTRWLERQADATESNASILRELRDLNMQMLLEMRAVRIGVETQLNDGSDVQYELLDQARQEDTHPTQGD